MKTAVNGLLDRTGHTLVGDGGLRHLDSYAVVRARLPEPWLDPRVRPGCFEVDLARVTTPCGFSYAPDGWHPYAQLLEELLAEPDLPYERTALHRFYARFRPRTVQDALLDQVDEPLDPIGRWPAVLPLFKHFWALTPRRRDEVLRDPERVKGGRQQFGPHEAEFGRTQVERTATAYRSVADHGYHPERYRDGHLTGYFLVRDDDYRFVVFHGNHRLAAFRLLGIERPLARLQRGHPPVIDVAELDRLPACRRGVIPVEVARRVFDALFDESGRTKAARLGLL